MLSLVIVSIYTVLYSKMQHRYSDIVTPERMKNQPTSHKFYVKYK